MRIIVDGNDGVGKTTLAKKLQEHFNIKSYVHLSYKDPTNYKFYSQILKKQNIIFDRSFLDELVYSKILRRKSNLNKREFKKLHNQIVEDNYIVIICITENNKFDDDEYIEIKQNKNKIDKFFLDIAKDKKFILFDPINDSYKELLLDIYRRIDNEKLY